MFIPKNPYYTIIFSGKNACNMAKILYYPNSPLSMPRKQALSEKLIYLYESVGSSKIHH